MALYFPEWSIERAKKSLNNQSSKIVLTSDAYGAALIKRFSKELASGLEEGSSLELARALYPDLVTAPFEPKKDFEALKKLAHWLTRFSPLVGIEREALAAAKEGPAKQDELFYLDKRYMGILLNITGTERLYGKKEPQTGTIKLARTIYKALTRSGLTVQIGVAPNTGAAWALSRYENAAFSHIQKKEEIRESLACFPIAALRIPQKTVHELHDLGIYDIQSLLRLPRKELAVRFGVKLIRSLDEFFGEVPEPLTPLIIKESLREEHSFDPPLTTQKQIVKGLLFTLQKLLQRAEELHRKPFLFRFTLSGLDRQYRSFVREKRISLHTGTADTKYLETTLTPLIESIKFPGTVSDIHLEVCDDGMLSPSQISHEPTVAIRKEAPQELLNTFSIQLGTSAIRTLTLKESHIPEKSFQFSYLPPGKVPIPTQTPSVKELPKFSYPSLIFPKPQNIKALSLLPDYPPIRITWKAREYKIMKSIGPERVWEEWWEEHFEKDAHKEREYFRLLDDTGRWLWVYRQREDLRWYLHGVWS